MTTTLLLLRGLPGSGKTTYAKELLRKESRKWIRVNRDSIRAEMFNDASFDNNNEEFVREIRDNLITLGLKSGRNVVVDDTNLIVKTIKRIEKIARGIGDVKVVYKSFNVSIDECLKRNALREGKARVPDNVVLSMAKASGITKGGVLEDREVYYPPLDQSVEKYVPDLTKPRAIVCDMDGTLSLLNGRNPYDASTCDNDLPNKSVIECVKAMKSNGYEIIFLSGREIKYRSPTQKFIAQHLPNLEYELYMRADNDSRKDSIIKGELFQQHIASRFNVVFALDDRDQIVKYWRLLGISTFQVNYGDF